MEQSSYPAEQNSQATGASGKGANGDGDTPTVPSWLKIGWMNTEDQDVLRRWREFQIIHDTRLESKGLLELGALAMTNREFRSRLISDPDSTLRKFQEEFLPLPQNLSLTFLENSRSAANIVLPPPAGAVKNRPPALRDALRSGTNERFLDDDFDIPSYNGDKGMMDGSHHYYG
jgi:hypothetical protein